MTRVYKAEDAAKYLCVHVETIRRLARNGELPAMKVGRGWRFNESELLYWAKTHHLISLKSRITHILVVDDDEITHGIIRDIFLDKPYRISSAHNGEKALDLIRADRPDVVLLDLMLSGMNGSEILREIRKFEDSLPVIFITGYPDSDLLMEALSITPVLVLKKPVEPEKLVAAVELAVNGSRLARALSQRL